MTQHHSRLHPTSRIAFLLLALFGLFVPGYAAKFDIPAQPAAAALKLFNKQSAKPVVFINDELRDVTTNQVQGEMEPADALTQLIAGTSLTISKTTDKNFVLASTVVRPGSIEGSVRDESGKPVAGAKVALADSDQAVATDKRGRFLLTGVVAGAHVLQITAEGLQSTRVTDVAVHAGRELSMSPITIPVRKQGTLELDTYTVSAKKNDGVIELDPYAVSGTKQQPFANGNMDIPRTINDTQPYYIFDAKTIDQSGATNIEGFLKNRLTMNTTAITTSQDPASLLGNTSSINLRGLGTNATLLLVNGRRIASVSYNGANQQPDINGLPLGAVERIEVLPTSASGIYGGGALGGAINIILKRNYSGGELRLTYENPFDTDAPIRSAALSAGFIDRSGKTHFMLTARASDSAPLFLQERRSFIDRGYNAFLKVNPNFFTFTSAFPVLGATPNIASSDGSNLTLKGSGTSLNSPFATLPAGYSATSNPAAIIPGRWNLDLPATNQTPTGLMLPLGNFPRDESVVANLRRTVTNWLEMFVDGATVNNHSEGIQNPVNSFYFVPASAPNNPFNQQVVVRFPFNSDTPIFTDSKTRTATFGILLTLPSNWSGELDYSWSRNWFQNRYFTADATALNLSTGNYRDGTINILVDTLLFPPDFTKFFAPSTYSGASTVDDYSLRLSGPSLGLPSGAVNLTAALQHRREKNGDADFLVSYPLTPANSTVTTFFGHEQSVDAAYLEALIPIVNPRKPLPLVHSLELQVAGRAERYKVSLGTTSRTVLPNRTPVSITWSPQTPPNGVPFVTETTYESVHPTVGLKWEPVESVVVRASYATAFLPPTYGQLLPNPIPNNGVTFVIDPKKQIAGQPGSILSNGNYFYPAQIIGGGNPNLVPQNSESWNFGLIWEPRSGWGKGLRLNAEYYQIDQADAIGSLTPQQLVNEESAFPDRIIRNSATGLLTQINASLLNLARRKSSGWDFSASYKRPFAPGTLNVFGAASLISYEKRQSTHVSPLLDFVGFPNQGGAAKLKGNLTTTWEMKHWELGWTTRYFGSYSQNGSANDPVTPNAPNTYIIYQGSSRIGSQLYHDAFVTFRTLDTPPAGTTRNLAGKITGFIRNTRLQLGVKNVFDAMPPLDVFRGPFYYSPYGEIRMRSYWLNLTKSF